MREKRREKGRNMAEDEEDDGVVEEEEEVVQMSEGNEAGATCIDHCCYGLLSVEQLQKICQIISDTNEFRQFQSTGANVHY